MWEECLPTCGVENMGMRALAAGHLGAGKHVVAELGGKRVVAELAGKPGWHVLQDDTLGLKIHMSAIRHMPPPRKCSNLSLQDGQLSR